MRLRRLLREEVNVFHRDDFVSQLELEPVTTFWNLGAHVQQHWPKLSATWIMCSRVALPCIKPPRLIIGPAIAGLRSPVPDADAPGYTTAPSLE